MDDLTIACNNLKYAITCNKTYLSNSDYTKIWNNFDKKMKITRINNLKQYKERKK